MNASNQDSFRQGGGLCDLSAELRHQPGSEGQNVLSGGTSTSYLQQSEPLLTSGESYFPRQASTSYKMKTIAGLLYYLRY